MNGEVNIKIYGCQTQENGDRDETSQSFVGRYHREGKLHCIAYKEDLEGQAYTLHTIRFGEDQVLIRRKGSVNAMLHLEGGCRHMADYRTPYGQLGLELEATHIELQETEEQLALQADYHMYLEGSYFASCQIHIEVEGM